MFAFELWRNGKALLSQFVKQRVQTLVLSSQNATQVTELNNHIRRPGHCGVPDYEVSLRISLRNQLALNVTDSITERRTGLPMNLGVRAPHCVPAEMPFVWPVYNDRRFLVQPNFYFSSIHMIWQIEDRVIDQLEGELSFSKVVTIPVDDEPLNDGTELRNVTVGFRVETIAASSRLYVSTRGEHGNFPLKVSLLLKFHDNQPPVVSHEQVIYVAGQTIDGNDAYHKYVACIEHTRKTMMKYVQVQPLTGPGFTVRRLRAAEQGIRTLTDALGTRRSR